MIKQPGIQKTAAVARVEEKHPHTGIAWSGGLDSTAVVLHCLREGHFVDLCSLRILNKGGRGQHRREERARNKIVAWLDDHRRDFKGRISLVQNASLDIDWVRQTGEDERESTGSLLVSCLIPLMTDAPRVGFGYCRTDHFWRFQVRFRNRINSLFPNKKLWFPMRYLDKLDIARRYYSGREDLFEICAEIVPFTEADSDLAAKKQQLKEMRAELARIRKQLER
ncbi:MAG: hypothetical protein ACREIF_01645 [Chthoniobacterales bacterium]